jgi:hypothetical protein
MSSPHIERLQQTSSEKSDAPSFRQRRPLPFLFFLRLCLYSGGSEPHPPPSSARNISPQVRSACAFVFPAPFTVACDVVREVSPFISFSGLVLLSLSFFDSGFRRTSPVLANRFWCLPGLRLLSQIDLTGIAV